jgi:hypothetical protein
MTARAEGVRLVLAARDLSELNAKTADSRGPRSGAWPSPFAIDLLTRGAVAFARSARPAAALVLEGRAEEGGAGSSSGVRRTAPTRG